MNNRFLRLAFTVGALALPLGLTAGHDLQRFQQQALQLNTFCVGHPKIERELSRLIKADPILVQKAIENEKCKAIGLVAAHLITQKTKQPLFEFLACNESTDWACILRKNGVPLSEALGYLQNLNTELAFVALDGNSRKLRK